MHFYPCIFRALDASWGPHSVCFASSYNAPLPCFHSGFWSPGCEAVDTFGVMSRTGGCPLTPCLSDHHSRFWSPGCEAVDTFTVNWGNELNWWVPPYTLFVGPFSMLHSVGRTLIIPAWKSAPFWPIICPDG